MRSDSEPPLWQIEAHSHLGQVMSQPWGLQPDQLPAGRTLYGDKAPPVDV